MSPFERHQLIVGLLAEHGSVSASGLMKRLNCSIATVRRDLSVLEKDGKVARTHGGGILPLHLAVEPTFSDKSKFSGDQKAAIGHRVAEELPEGATVYVDSGTTCMEAGKALLERGKNRIITNSIPLLVAGCRYPGQVQAIGGDVRQVSQALVGGLAVPWMHHLRFDFALLGTSGITTAGEVMTTELQEATVKSLALERCDQACLLADSDKFKATSAISYALLKQFTKLFTDKRILAERTSKWSREHGLLITRC